MQLLLDSRASNGAMLGVIPAVPDGLAYFNIFSDPASRPDRNLVPGRPPARLYGVITPNGTFATFSETNYLDTGVPDGDARTCIVVGGIAAGQAGDGKWGYFLGSYLPDALGFNVLIPSYAPLAIKSFVGRTVGGNAVGEETGAIPPGAFLASCHRASSAYGTRVDNLTQGGSPAVRQPAAGPRIISPRNYLIGRAPFVAAAGSNFYGSVNVVAIIVWTRVLSDAEMTAAYAQLKILLADQGVAI
ncbi:MAG: hypothetical protein ACAH20_14450 [Methylobacteriaceae bacterium]